MPIVKLKNVRLAFPDLYEPRADENGDNPKFGANFIFEKGDPNHKAMSRAFKEAATEKWKANGEKVIKSLETNKKCLRDGDTNLDKEGNVRDGYEDKMYVVARRAPSKGRPMVLDRDKSPLVQADGKPYGGCYVNATVEVYALDKPKIGKSINAELRGVQFVKDGEAFSGGTALSEDEFDSLEEDEFDDDLGGDEDDDLV